ncbi:uncharacterized protein APUU_61040A [Aspergillus puulaauensis]|uniref:Alcohol dehydrogenase-like C-terminal domain-containing protein n=1 Tax=Aspergillus puulaauensis TaxID=1220207 RepID=A0A7R7XV54_9EURO|nr:uncharacterized protein APUU_61040A [Aspergillus puulaauensis]BCS27992.1 hypothetical protein APUU_61040A [Aspergillus puulaauensis]
MKAPVYQGKQMRAAEPPNTDYPVTNRRRSQADETANLMDKGAIKKLDTLSRDHGLDSATGAVGYPGTFGLFQRLLAPGGSITNVGVHGQPAQLALDGIWDPNISE